MQNKLRHAENTKRMIKRMFKKLVKKMFKKMVKKLGPFKEI